MCGIAGAIAPPDRLDEEALRQLGTRMGAAIAHRGPDDAGTWTDAAAGLVLAHRRLAIVDLSPEGHQPMMSDDGRWVIAFNGEIYNHHTLRGELAARGQAFRGHSDTEVLLAAIAHWGRSRTPGATACWPWPRPASARCGWHGTASARSPCTTAGPGTARSCSAASAVGLPVPTVSSVLALLLITPHVRNFPPPTAFLSAATVPRSALSRPGDGTQLLHRVRQRRP